MQYTKSDLDSLLSQFISYFGEDTGNTELDFNDLIKSSINYRSNSELKKLSAVNYYKKISNNINMIIAIRKICNDSVHYQSIIEQLLTITKKFEKHFNYEGFNRTVFELNLIDDLDTMFDIYQNVKLQEFYCKFK
jgi:hypothetical protein